MTETVSVVVKHQDFFSAISKSISMIQSKNPIMRFVNIKFESKTNTIFIFSTDGKITLINSIRILQATFFKKDFDVLADPKILSQILPSISSDTITLECSQNSFKLVIKGGGHEYGCNSQDPEDYPKFVFSDNAEDKGLKIPSGFIRKSLSNTQSAINPKSTVDAITGAFIDYHISQENGEDIFRLFTIGMTEVSLIYVISNIKLGDKSFSCIVPYSFITASLKIIDESDDIRIKVLRDEDGKSQRIFFSSPRYEIGFLPFPEECEFPDYNSMIPGGIKEKDKEQESNLNKISIPVEALKEAISYSTCLADKEHNIVKIKFSPKKQKEGEAFSSSGDLMVTSESDLGYAKIKPVEVKVIKGAEKDHIINVCGTNLLNIISILSGNDVIMSYFDDPLGVIRFDSGAVSMINTGGIILPVDMITE